MLLLPYGLIENNASGHGQIQTSDIRIGHRDSIASLRVFVQKKFRQPLCFFAKDQEVSWVETGLGVGSTGFFAEQEQTFQGLTVDKGCKAWPMDNRDVLPVIKSSPFQVAIIGAETQGVNQVQGGVGGSAQAGDTAGVGRNFRFHQDDMKRGLVWHRERGLHNIMFPLEERDVVLLGDGQIADFENLGEWCERGKVSQFDHALHFLFELA